MINNLFSLFYYHGRVENHEKLKELFLSEISDESSLHRIGIVNYKHPLVVNLKRIFLGMNGVLDLHNQLGGDPNVNLSMIDAWVNQYNVGDS